MSRARILYIDDEPINLSLFSASFGHEFEVFTANNGEAGLEMLAREGEMAVVLADQRMPGQVGIDVLARVRELYPDTIRIMVTAYTDTDYLIDAINRGHVYQYVVKPWKEQELRFTLAHSVKTYRLTKRNQELLNELEAANRRLRRLNTELEERVASRTRELSEANRQLQASYDQLAAAKALVDEQKRRLTAANAELARRIEELEAARREIRELAAVLPICSYCKKIRDDANYWLDLERYLQTHADIAFSHAICPECYRKEVKPELEAFGEQIRAQQASGTAPFPGAGKRRPGASANLGGSEEKEENGKEKTAGKE